MIIGVCSGKGAPGVTILATALSLAWPGDTVLLEADPSGADLSFRLRPSGAGMTYLAREPTVLSLALAARTSAPGADLIPYTHRTSLGVRVILGVLGEDRAAMAPMWALVTEQIRAWPGTVVVDLGRLHAHHDALGLAAAADVLLLVAHHSVEGLFHARETAGDLLSAFGAGARSSPRVGVVIRAGRRQQDAAVREITHVLERVGVPVPVAGWIADDPAGVAALLNGSDDRRLERTALMGSVRELITRVHRTWVLDPSPAGRDRGGRAR